MSSLDFSIEVRFEDNARIIEKMMILSPKVVEKEKNVGKTVLVASISSFSPVFFSFLLVLFSSTGRRPASLYQGPLSVVRSSVCASVRA